MNIQQAYNSWAGQYDTNPNKTRDLEAIALKANAARISFTTCLEIGCGTGKNTEWLLTKAQYITAVDLSEEMLAKAKEKINSNKVVFIQADINQPWVFSDRKFDFISFSLVLEHIEDLDAIFKKAAETIVKGGYVYAGELHPFKQYNGSKARFNTENGEQILTCFNHHVSDFIQAAKKYGFEVSDLNEYFDDGDRNTIPRILTIIFRKE